MAACSPTPPTGTPTTGTTAIGITAIGTTATGITVTGTTVTGTMATGTAPTWTNHQAVRIADGRASASWPSRHPAWTRPVRWSAHGYWPVHRFGGRARFPQRTRFRAAPGHPDARDCDRRAVAGAALAAGHAAAGCRSPTPLG